MDRAKHLALATAAEAAGAAPSVAPGSRDGASAWPIRPHAIDGRVAIVDEELSKLRRRCRARELALASMAGAVATLRRANRALTDENTLLRQQVAELEDRVVGSGPRLSVAGGE